MKSIIFCSYPKYLWFFRNFKTYVRSSLLEKKACSKNFPIGDDIFSGSDYRFCDHQASLIEDMLIKKLVKRKSFKFLSTWGGHQYAYFFFGKALIKEAQQVFESFGFAKKVYTSSSLKGNVYIFPNNFSLTVYREIRSLNLIPEYLKIHPLVLLHIYFHNIIKYLYFFSRMILYPELILSRAGLKSSSFDSKFRSCVHLDDGLLSINKSSSLSENDKVFSLFSDDETLYVDDRFRSSQKWPNLVKNIGKNVLRLEDLPSFVEKKQYFKSVYKNAFRWRYEMVWLSLNYPFICSASSRALRLKILWDIFYLNFKIKNSIRMMIEENNTSSLVHRENQTRTIFIYFSTTNSMINRVDDSKSMTHEYTHMIVDDVVSSILSNNWIKSLENNVKNYVSIGPIFSDLVFLNSKSKKQILNKLKMSDDLRVVSCFDNTVGHKGVFNFDAYLQFLNSLFLLAEKNKQINFVFKGKKNLLYMNLSFNHELESLLNKLEQLDNFIILHKPLVTTFELIGLSDLVISAPRSSVIYEALCGGVKAISFDPLNQCSVYNDITQSFHNLNAYSDDELNNLFEYWMFNSSKKEFEIFLNRYVKPNLDKNASKGNMIIRFKNYLKN